MGIYLSVEEFEPHPSAAGVPRPVFRVRNNRRFVPVKFKVRFTQKHKGVEKPLNIAEMISGKLTFGVKPEFAGKLSGGEYFTFHVGDAGEVWGPGMEEATRAKEFAEKATKSPTVAMIEAYVKSLGSKSSSNPGHSSNPGGLTAFEKKMDAIRKREEESPGMEKKLVTRVELLKDFIERYKAIERTTTDESLREKTKEKREEAEEKMKETKEKLEEELKKLFKVEGEVLGSILGITWSKQDMVSWKSPTEFKGITTWGLHGGRGV